MCVCGVRVCEYSVCVYVRARACVRMCEYRVSVK